MRAQETLFCVLTSSLFYCIVLTKIMLQHAVFAVTAIAKNKQNTFEQKSNYYNMDYNPIGPIICLILTGGKRKRKSCKWGGAYISSPTQMFFCRLLRSYGFILYVIVESDNNH